MRCEGQQNAQTCSPKQMYVGRLISILLLFCFWALMPATEQLQLVAI